METELWKPVVGTDGWYEVSNQGHVRSWHRRGDWTKTTRAKEPKVLKTSPNVWGYLVVNISRNGKWQKPVAIQILVLTAFVGPCPPSHEACHWDGIRTNNNLSNLRWGTRTENMQDAIRHGTIKRGEREPNHVLKTKQVYVIKKLLKSGLSISDTAKEMGIHYDLVYPIARNKAWKWVEPFL